MDMLINLLALAFIGFIVWWFWLAKSGDVQMVRDSIDVIVDGGIYSPAIIEVGRGQSIILNFIRRDVSPCAGQVIFAELGISAELPLTESKKIELTLDNEGEFGFTCQMGMYRGKLIVK